MQSVKRNHYGDDTDADRGVDAKGFNNNRCFVQYLLVTRYILNKAKFASDMF